ncbi:hypothetical protein ACFQ3S_08230 [Mucilaginibacter terrae]|uniref:hypothetical protein n=1 Tax=Mucilaginibacter terrae TaxID=1955052 RepID=UPI00362903EF
MMQQPANSTFKALQMITLALCSGVILFLLVAIFINQHKLVLMPANDPNTIIIYIAIALSIVSVISSNILFNILLKKIDTNTSVKEKFTKYVAAYITRYALLEGAALFNVVALLLSGCLISAGVALMLIIFMLSIRPQRSKTIEDLKIYYPDTLE